MRPLQLSVAIAAGIIFSTLTALAWSGPSSSPPNGNVDAPINVGTATQSKNGNLALFGNFQLAANGGSYLNFGATSGSTGYGIRDNSGTLEFKSTGGSWNNLTNTVTNVLGIGAVSQIKFSDGTTQTTAAASAPVSFVAAMHQIGITVPKPPGLAAWPNQIICRASGGSANSEILVPLNECVDQSCSQVWALKQDGIYVAIDTATGAFTVARFNPTCGAPQATIQSVCNAGRCVF